MAGREWEQCSGVYVFDVIFWMDQQEPVRAEEEEGVPKDYLNRKISELSELQLRYTYSNASSTSEFSMYEQNSEQFEAKFVRDEELYAEMIVKANQIQSTLNIDDQDLCLYILQHYQWNEEKLTDQYFSDDWSALTHAHLDYAALAHLDHDAAPCPVCLTHAPLYSTGLCPHAYCANCWTGYLRHELQSGRIYPTCMQVVPCARAPVLRGFVEAVAPEVSELNLKKTCVSYAVRNKDICYCPNDKCPYFCVKPNMMEMNTVACPCGQLYCYRCRNQPHFPIACEDVKRWYNLLNSEETNSNWIRNNTRECPKCKLPIEKKVGCSHMKCLCQCEFCYQCNRPWDEPHAVRKTECPNRALLPRREKNSDRIVELDNYLGEMMREADKNRELLTQCEGLIQDDTLRGRVVQLKTDVVSAWMTLKWTKIVLCLDGNPDIDSELEKEYIESIHSVMEPVQIIIKNAKCLAELHYYGEQVLQRKELLKKNVRTWLDAWEVASTPT